MGTMFTMIFPIQPQLICIGSTTFSVSYCVNLVYYSVRSTILNKDCALIIVAFWLTC